MEREFVRVNVAVMMVSDAPSTLDEATGKLIVDKLAEAGHNVIPIEVVGDAVDKVTARFQQWIRNSELDVVIAMAGIDSDATKTAIAPLITKPLTGFSELFRLLTYNEIGTGAMLTDVIAAQCDGTFVFVLPASKGAVATALEKILVPQLDHRTKPRNLVQRMPRLKPGGSYLEASGPKAFPVENTPFGVPPPPSRKSSRPATMPPPVPKRASAVHMTPPLPVSVVTSLPRSIADAEVAELDPGAVIEDPSGEVPIKALEAAIERSIESTGKPMPEAAPAKPLDDNDPSAIAAREHAEKTPEAQAAAWVAAVEQAASKVVKKAAADREAREASKPGIKLPPLDDPEPAPAEVEAQTSLPRSEVVEASSMVVEEKSEPKVATDEDELLDEPRGKIEKASGKAPPKPDHAIDEVAAVIVEDPDLVERASRSKLPSIAPPLPAPRNAEPDLPVFPRRSSGDELVARPKPVTRKSNTPWVLLGGIAVIVAVVLLVFVVGKRNKSVAATDITPPPTPPPTTAPGGVVEETPTPTPTPTPPAPTPTPDPTATDIEMDPHHKATDPKPAVVAPNPNPPKPKDNPDDPDLTKAPANPANAGDGCDEVACILDKFAKPCCERFKPAEQPKPPQPVATGPVELDKTLIKIGVERFRPQIIRCGEQAVGVKGTVRLTVVVRPDGLVDNVTVAESPDPALGTCAAAVMRKATFAKTQNGGTFTYPFEFAN